MVTPYTHMDFAEDVRRLVLARRGASLSPAERTRITMAQMFYMCHVKDFAIQFQKIMRKAMHEEPLKVLGATRFDTYPVRVEIYAEDESPNRMDLAYTVIHELGHVATGNEDEGHSLLWEKTIERMGIMHIGDLETLYSHYYHGFLDLGLYDAIAKLPELTDTVAVKEQLSKETLGDYIARHEKD